MVTKTLIAQARDQLTEEQKRLTSQIQELEEQGRLESWRDSQPDLVDAGTAAVEREQVQALADRVAKRLKQVEHALARIEDGSYGRCEVCGEEIAEERLDALPAASTCVKHVQS